MQARHFNHPLLSRLALLRWLGAAGLVTTLGLGRTEPIAAVEPHSSVTTAVGVATRRVDPPHFAPRGVAVADGRATFDLRVENGGAPSLVIVSSLAPTAGPFPIEVRVTPTLDKPRPLPAPLAPVIRLPDASLPPLAAIPPAARTLPAAERTFHLMTQAGVATSADSYQAIPARLLAIGRRVQVYGDVADLAAIDPAALRDVVATFDDQVWPRVAERFGPAADIDGDGRFTVLLTRWLGRLADGRVQVDGFVRGADFDRRQPAPFGNGADLMFLNADLRSGPHLRTVLAHEYMHAVTFSRKVLDGGHDGPINPLSEEEGWLDEALAHLVEDELEFSRSNIAYRVSAYLSLPEHYRLVVEDYYLADLFRSHGNRGATFLFLRWCVDQHGSRLLDALVRSPRRGVANLEAATGVPFAELFRRWTVATYRSGLDSDPPGAGDYRSLTLRGEVGDWLLAGPRLVNFAAGDPPHRWSSAGTAAHYLVVGRHTPGTVRVEVTGPAAADLQVTVVPLPPGLARPELAVEPVVAADGTIRARARLVESGGVPVRLAVLAWERLVPRADPHSVGFRHDALATAAIGPEFGSSTLPARGLLRSNPIFLPEVRSDDGPLVFKVVGVDARGHRVAAWATADWHRRPDLTSAGNAYP